MDFKMFQKFSCVRLCGVLLLLFNIYCVTAASKLIVIEVNLDNGQTTHLRSSHADIGYPKNRETLDVIWLFSHSIRLAINEFHLDGHHGDFLLVSDIPLKNAEDFKQMNLTEDNYVEKLAQSILTDQGLLLSWKVDKNIKVLNELGTFVLFHAEGRPEGSTTQFKGFDIEASNFDDERRPSTTTTPTPEIPERPGQEIYVYKYVIDLLPMEFVERLNDFKRVIARLATDYCREEEINLEEGPILRDEVNIPGKTDTQTSGLHYCDPTWEPYPRCIEVKFAIDRLNSSGYFVLPATKLSDMWEKKADELRQEGFTPYNPPKRVLNFNNTVLWVGFFLGIILGLTAILGIAWIKNTRSLMNYRKSFANSTSNVINQIKLVEDKPDSTKNYDSHNQNPIYKMVSNPTPNGSNELYPSRNYLDDEEPPAPYRKHSFMTNPAFQHNDVDVHAFDNSGYEHDQPDYMYRGPKSEKGLYLMSTHDEGNSDTDI